MFSDAIIYAIRVFLVKPNVVWKTKNALCMIHAKRVTILKKDLQLARRNLEHDLSFFPVR